MGNMEKLGNVAQVQQVNGIRPYEAPSIRVMDDQEALSAFQVTVAAISWWVM